MMGKKLERQWRQIRLEYNPAVEFICKVTCSKSYEYSDILHFRAESFFVCPKS